MLGYAGKLLFVNLTTGTLADEPLDEKMARNFLGGPGLGARILYERMPAKADVFGPDSMIGFLCGPANNTLALFGGRYNVVSKSPVTGGWNDSNSGGYFAPGLKKAGYDAVFINGISENPVYLFIENGSAQILDASDIWGKKTIETETILKERHGKDIEVALVGPAGENMSWMAAIMNDEHRAAGRGGSGAVMGSKKLKAIAVKGNAKTEVLDNEKIVEVNKAAVTWMKEGPGARVATPYGEYGTGVALINSVLSGDAGVKNWSGAGAAEYTEEAAKPMSSIGQAPFRKKKYNCSSCAMRCGAIMEYQDEKLDHQVTARPEYETQGAFGPLMMNKDVSTMIQCNILCNEYGLDTISAGGTIAWAMECYSEGVLTKEELDGIELAWGNSEAILAILEKICRNEGVGKILALGSREASRRFGKGEEYLVTASGIEEPQHDSRLSHGLTRLYKYDPTPGRHVKGGLGLLPLPADFDYHKSGEADKQGVITSEICNSGGFCFFCKLCSPPGSFKKYIEAITGFTYTDEEFQKVGLRIYNYRHAFNLREGMNRESFTLSPRMSKAQPPFEGPLKDVDVDVELLADNFFDAMHFDRNTLIPDIDHLREIGEMDPVIADLEQKADAV